MKNIVIGLFAFLLVYPIYSQEIFMYGESGTKLYFQRIDSLVQVKFSENISDNERIAVAKTINPDKAYTEIANKNRILIPINKNKKPNFVELKKNKSIIYANQSLKSSDGTIQIPTDKVFFGIKNTYDPKEVFDKLEIEYDSFKRLGHNKNAYLLMLKNGESLKVANQLYESGYFDYAQPCFTRLMKVMNEFYEDQWGLNNTGQNGGNVGVDINAPEAWELTRGCNNITVAVIDQGVDLDHPDLAGNLLAGHDATDGGDGGLNGDCWGDNAHGTCCAGIIGAIDNMIGTIGVAHGCRIIPIRVSYAFEDTEVWDEDWIVEAINHAWAIVDADILSCSWGGGAASIPINNEINDALTLGRNGLGCIIAFSTGNNNTSVSWPANGNPDIIAVGAMSPCGERKRSSSNIWDLNPGVFPDPEDVSCDNEKWWGSNYGDELDLVAPVVFVPTTDIQGTAGYDTSSGTNGNYYLTFNGTSAATPHVAGVAALILSINPALTQDEVCDIIESTCKKTGSYSYTTTSGRTNGTWNNEMGYGLVNAYAAVANHLMKKHKNGLIGNHKMTKLNFDFQIFNGKF